MSTSSPQPITITEALQIALEHHKGGRIPQAKRLYQQILDVDPDHAQALHQLGRLLFQAGQHGPAAELISKAATIRPDIAEFHANLGECRRLLGDLAQAEASHRQAVALEPGNPMLHLHLANTLMDAGQEAAANTEYEAACRLSLAGPAATDTLVRLAAHLERTNRAAGARILVAHGLRRHPDAPGLQLLDAKLDRREGRAATAVAKLDALLGRALPDAMQADLRFELGRAHDRAGNTDRAFRMFQEGNLLREEMALSMGIQRGEAVRELLHMAESITPQWVASWGTMPPPAERPAPVFLVGFPRSGTTLLEQITGSHSAIRTSEEKPYIAMLEAKLARTAPGYPGAIPGLTADEIMAMRSAYFDAADAVAGAERDKVLLDKFPLNIRSVPLIQRVFPDASFILVLRHPADAVLSCFMQDFGLNRAMVNFLRLEDAAAMYDAVMRIWLRSVECLPLRYHVIRYERLVADFESEVRQLIEFMGLAWEDDVKNYQATAKRRAHISTPSYNQVSEPIYHRAVDRWRLYEPHIEPIMPALAPWLELFGYPT
jgi:tetratricopeptide (TPR) repeat protein